jgi:hypothetical protein
MQSEKKSMLKDIEKRESKISQLEIELCRMECSHQKLVNQLEPLSSTTIQSFVKSPSVSAASHDAITTHSKDPAISSTGSGDAQGTTEEKSDINSSLQCQEPTSSLNVSALHNIEESNKRLASRLAFLTERLQAKDEDIIRLNARIEVILYISNFFVN